MLFIITGNGKGKTTSALGMIARASGQGLKCAVIQFLKSNPTSLGEYKTFTQLGIPWHNYGCGFLWNQDNLAPTQELCQQGWQYFKAIAQNGCYDMILLDEFTYVLSQHILEPEPILSYLRSNIAHANCSDSPSSTKFPHVIITGRDAPQDLINLADTVSEIKEIKHHYYTNGGKTLRGIEF